MMTAAAVWSPLALVAQAAEERNQPAVIAAPDLAAAMVLYRRALAEYQSARASYDGLADSYWRSIAEKRRLRRAKRANHETIALDDYVLAQPPVYRAAEAARSLEAAGSGAAATLRAGGGRFCRRRAARIQIRAPAAAERKRI
jgi:hypothetical protein